MLETWAVFGGGVELWSQAGALPAGSLRLCVMTHMFNTSSDWGGLDEENRELRALRNGMGFVLCLWHSLA